MQWNHMYKVNIQQIKQNVNYKHYSDLIELIDKIYLLCILYIYFQYFSKIHFVYVFKSDIIKNKASAG